MNPDATLDESDEEVMAKLKEQYGDRAQHIADAFKQAYSDKRLLEKLFGATKALLELLRSDGEKEVLNKRDPTAAGRGRTPEVATPTPL